MWLVSSVGTSIARATSLLASSNVSATWVAACTPFFAADAMVLMNCFALRSPSFARMTTCAACSSGLPTSPMM